MTQFGDVKNVVVSRSRKTGKSRGYGFVQFEDPLVARIAAETLNGYPLSDRVLKAHVLDPEKTHPGMFRHANRKWKSIPWRTVRKQFEEVPVTKEAAHMRLEKLVEKERAQEEKWKALGIDYEFENSYAKQISEIPSEEESGDESDVENAEPVEQTPVEKRKRTQTVEVETDTPQKKAKSTNVVKGEEEKAKTNPVTSKSPKKVSKVQEDVAPVNSKSPKTRKTKSK